MQEAAPVGSLPDPIAANTAGVFAQRQAGGPAFLHPGENAGYEHTICDDACSGRHKSQAGGKGGSNLFFGGGAEKIIPQVAN